MVVRPLGAVRGRPLPRPRGRLCLELPSSSVTRLYRPREVERDAGPRAERRDTRPRPLPPATGSGSAAPSGDCMT